MRDDYGGCEMDGSGIYEYGKKDAGIVLIQMVDQHDLERIENELAYIRQNCDKEFLLIAVAVDNWNEDLSPWEAPAVYGKDGFGGGAEKTLKRVLELCKDNSRAYYIGGYSLAGLFALWAASQSSIFCAVAAASPSVWFPGFTDHIKRQGIKCGMVYLSLGDKEEKNRNPIMSTVGDRIRELHEFFKEHGLETFLEWNEGNHFKDSDIRMAKAFVRVLEQPLVVRSRLISFPHGFSTRLGGVSKGIFTSLNLGMNRGDDKECVKENYRRFFAACGIEGEGLVCGRQVHGKTVMIVDAEDVREPYGYEELFEADGYVSNTPGVAMGVFTADCIPLLLADEKNKVAAAVHSGWRGTVQDIENEAIEKMLSLGAESGCIRACIGPAIGRCCFEVGAEVIEGVNGLLEGADDLYTLKENGRYMLDLKGVVKRCLVRSGVKEENIEVIDDCTMCMPGKYWSHRYTQGERGSQAAVIMIPPENR
ncbi:MAG: peptidoglycan editing factor PgeF [Lachnospiraceae bacterium]|nr:peptidoglycan editing factor PgeF [Lachnospiraceae bacterium]